MKYIFRLVIEGLQIVAACLWCFYLGTVLGVLMLVIGAGIGFKGGGWNDFFGGVLWCLGQTLPFVFAWIYRKLYGADEWVRSETFLGA